MTGIAAEVLFSWQAALVKQRILLTAGDESTQEYLLYTLETGGQRCSMVCRIGDVDDLFKAFNGGKAADFTAEDLAEQVCTWLALLCPTIGCNLPSSDVKAQGLLVPGRCLH